MLDSPTRTMYHRPPPEEPDIASMVPGPNGQCRIEGIQSSFGCYLALRMLAGKSALRCPNDDCDAHLMTVTRTVGGQVAATSRFYVTAGDPGWDGSLDGTYTWAPEMNNKIDLSDPSQAQRIVSQIPELLKNGEWLTRIGSQQTGSQQPQDIQTHIPIRNLLPEVYRLLDNDRCFTFIANLLNVARQRTGKRPYTYNAYELAFTIATRQ